MTGSKNHPREWWGGPPGPRPTPPSACWRSAWCRYRWPGCGTRASRADQGVRPTNPGDQFFMGFRGPKAHSNRPQKAVVCPTSDVELDVEGGALAGVGVEPDAAAHALRQQLDAVGAQAAAGPFRAERALEDMRAYGLRHNRVVVDGEAHSVGKAHSAARGGHTRVRLTGFECILEQIDQDAAEQGSVRPENNRWRPRPDFHVLIFREAEGPAGGDRGFQRLQRVAIVQFHGQIALFGGMRSEEHTSELQSL